MLSDTFPPRRRATVLAIYSSGIYIGGGLGLMIGGQVVDRWDAAFPPGGAPFGLKGWQAAYFLVGLPGLLLAIWVRTLREPVRGGADGLPAPSDPHPFRAFFRELGAVLPPFTLWHLVRAGAGGRAIARNLAVAGALAAVGAALVHVTGNLPQWSALALGVYAAYSWMSTLGLRDGPGAALLFQHADTTLRRFRTAPCWRSRATALAGWTPVFFRRVLAQPIGRGRNDRRPHGRRRGRDRNHPRRTRSPIACARTRPEGRLYVALAGALLPIPLVWWMLTTRDVTTAYCLNFPISVFASMWIGIGASTVQDLVLPRMRAVASAFYLLVITFVGFALGPYCIGALSDALGDLAAAMRISLLANLRRRRPLVARSVYAPARRVDAARAGARRRRARSLIESARATHLLLPRRLSRWARRRLGGLARLGPRARATCRAATTTSSTRLRTRASLVVFVDIAPGSDELRALAEHAAKLIVLDHHVTARERFANDLGLQNALAGRGHHIHFDLSHSGAMLAWNHFHPDEPAPDLLRYVEDQDLWAWKLPASEEVNAALASYPRDFEIWEELAARPIAELAAEGAPILRANRIEVERALQSAHPVAHRLAARRGGEHRPAPQPHRPRARAARGLQAAVGRRVSRDGAARRRLALLDRRARRREDRGVLRRRRPRERGGLQRHTEAVARRVRLNGVAAPRRFTLRQRPPATAPG